MCDTIKIKGKEGESMKPIKLKELIATAKDPATQKIVIAEGYGFDIPLFDGIVKDVDNGNHAACSCVKCLSVLCHRLTTPL